MYIHSIKVLNPSQFFLAFFVQFFCPSINFVLVTVIPNVVHGCRKVSVRPLEGSKQNICIEKASSVLPMDKEICRIGLPRKRHGTMSGVPNRFALSHLPPRQSYVSKKRRYLTRSCFSLHPSVLYASTELFRWISKKISSCNYINV